MADQSAGCRLCGSADIVDLGEIPDSDYFAGRVLEATIPGGRLVGCRSCDSMFRHPALPAPSYMTLYEAGAPTQWSGGDKREDFRIIGAMLATSVGNPSILDLGCGSGDFLDSLTGNFLKNGIEPSSAARHAASRGVKILAPDIEQLVPDAQFDVITIIDVIEHVTDPASLLSAAYAHVAPGGKIIVSTGDPECPWWRRVFKSKFWYASFPEHVSFPSLGFFRLWCERNDARIGARRVVRHQSLGRWRFAWSALAQMAYYLSPVAFNWMGRTAARVAAKPGPSRRTFSPGIPGVFLDHHIMVIERPLI